MSRSLARSAARAGLVLALAAALLGQPTESAADGAWPQFHGDGRHAGLGAAAGPRSLALAWYASGTTDVDGSAAIDAQGRVYYAHVDGTLRALHPDGGERWVYKDTGRQVTTIYGTPVIGQDGRIIVGDTRGRLRAFNADDGTIAWTVANLGSIRGPAAVGLDGMIYVGSDARQLYAFDGDGNEKFRLAAAGDIAAAPAIGPGGDVYWGASDGRLRRMNALGSVNWDVTLGGPILSSPAIGPDGTVYAGAGADVVAVDGASGAVKWRHGSGGEVWTTPAIGPDGTVYVGSDSGVFRAIGPSGAVKWEVQTGGAIRSSAAVGPDGVVYFGSGDANVYAVDADGRRLSTYRALDAVHGAVAMGPTGLIYAGSRDNRLYALKDSARPFSQSPPDRLGGDLLRDPQTGKVYVLVDGLRRHIPDPTTQLLLGLAGPLPINATGAELFRYPEGAPLPALAEGSLVRAANGPIYVIRDGKRVWIRSLADFEAGGYHWETVIVAEDRLVRSLPLALEDGTLVHGTDERVYVVEGGQRRWITSEAVLGARGYTWSMVHFVTDGAVRAVPEGAPVA